MKKTIIVLSLLCSFNMYPARIVKPIENERTGQKQDIRLISLDSMVSQFLISFGLADKLVAARVGSSIKETYLRKTYPYLFNNIDPGGPSTADIELILSLKPDIVFSSKGNSVERMKALGINVCVLGIESYSDIIDSIAEIGRTLDMPERAGVLISEFKRMAFNYLPSVFENKKRVYISGSNILQTFGNDFFQNELLQNIQAINVSASMKGGKINISAEELLKWDPEFIFIPAYGIEAVEQIKNDRRFRNINAVKRSNVFRIPYFFLSWDTPAPEALLCMIWMYGKIYPDERKYDMVEEFINFMRVFYGHDPDEEEISFIRDSVNGSK